LFQELLFFSRTLVVCDGKLIVIIMKQEVIGS
jgi:hypothetical protein